MNKAEKTKQQIIEKTAAMFNTKGYSVTSLSDITNATGLSKGSVYGNFKDKDEVVIEAFKYNVSIRSKGLNEAIKSANNPVEKLVAMVEFYRKSFEDVNKVGGCPMLNAATEADDHLLFLKKTVQQYFIGWQSTFKKVIKSGKEEGFFRSTINENHYSMEFLILIEGGILLSRILENKENLDFAIDRCLKIIKEEIII